MASWIHAFVWQQTPAKRSPRITTPAPPLVQALERTLRNPMGFFGAAVVGILVFAALAAA